MSVNEIEGKLLGEYKYQDMLLQKYADTYSSWRGSFWKYAIDASHKRTDHLLKQLEITKGYKS